MPDESVAVKVIDFLKVAGVTTQAVGGTNVLYTNSIPMPRNATFAFVLQFSSAGAVNVKVELEQGDARPATEGAVDAEFTVPVGASDVSAGITNETVNRIAYSPKVSAYCRLKLTGLASGSANDASTVLSRAQIVYVNAGN